MPAKSPRRAHSLAPLVTLAALATSTLLACSSPGGDEPVTAEAGSDAPSPGVTDDGGVDGAEASDASPNPLDATLLDAGADAGDATASDAGTDAAEPLDATDAAPVDASVDSADAGDAADAAGPDAEGPDAEGSDAALDAPADAPAVDAGPGGTSCTDVIDITSSLPNGAPVRVLHGGPVGTENGYHCKATATGSDTYLKFDAPAAGNYVITVFGGQASALATSGIFVRRACEIVDVNTELACSPNLDSSTLVGVDAPGEVYVVAAGAYFANGFSITVAQTSSCTTSPTQCTGFTDEPYCNADAGYCYGTWVCPAGTASCNPAQPDACETNTTNDPNNCSVCGYKCNFPGGTSVCASSQCVLTACNAGFTMCGTTSCVDTQSDPSNCNACGTSCKGGGCNAGVCSAPPTVLIPNAGAAVGADADAIYYQGFGTATTPGGLVRTALADLTTTQITPILPVDQVTAIAVGPNTVVVAGTVLGGSGPMTVLYAVPKTGGAWTLIAEASGSPVPGAASGIPPFAVDDTTVYFGGTLIPLSGPADGGVPMVNATTDSWWAVGLDPTYLYWVASADGSVIRVPKATPNATPQVLAQSLLASGESGQLQVSATDVLVADGKNAYRVPLDGSGATTLFAGGSSGEPMLFGPNAYVIANGGTVWRVPLAGSPPTEIGSITYYNPANVPLATSRGVVWYDGSALVAVGP